MPLQIQEGADDLSDFTKHSTTSKPNALMSSSDGADGLAPILVAVDGIAGSSEPSKVKFWAQAWKAAYQKAPYAGLPSFARYVHHSRYVARAGCLGTPTPRVNVRFGSLADITERLGMSALPPKADIRQRIEHVRFVP